MGIYQEEVRFNYHRIAVGYFLLLLAMRFFGGKFLMDFYGQPLKTIELSYVYWAVLYSEIPAWIMQNRWSCLLIDGLTLLLPILSLLSKKNARTWLGWALLVFFVQTVTVEVYSNSHSKSVVCIFMVLIPLLLEDKKFLLLADFAKYFGVSILLSAAYYKVVNGALLAPDNYIHVLINKHSNFALLSPESFKYQMSLFIIERPWLANGLFKVLFATQLLFFAGFITRKWDKWLIIPLAGFSTTTLIFMHIYNFDILIFAVPLWFSKDIAALYDLPFSKNKLNL